MPRDIQSAVASLESLDESALYNELGLRLKAIDAKPELAGDFGLTNEPSQLEGMGLREDFSEFGRKFYQRVSRQAYALVCGSDADVREEREKLASAIGIGKEGFAAALTALLVAQLGLAPAIATVVALLLVRLFFRPGLDAMCEVWAGGVQPAPTGN